jgi:hypothetical protein
MSNLNQTYKDHVYVMLSTLNQMVNYIPLKHYAFSGIYNITVTGSDYATNKKWDENLQKVLENDGITSNITSDEYNLKIEQDKVSDIDYIIETLEANFSNKKIFWNITGGQRPFVLAIQQIAEDNDVICYLEGNKSQMVLLQNNNEIKDMPNYDLDGLTIETALKLMGFKTNKMQSDENHLADESIGKFITEYKNTNNKLRKLMIETNKAMNESDAITKLKSLKLQNENAITTVIKWGYTKNKSTPFGYILEEMTYHIINTSKDKDNIQELKTNVRLYNDAKINEVNNTQIDEFDVLLLTKNGKLMVFECKSGSMHPDIAKSTKYSTYAVSGVYGLPILITPLLKNEIPPEGTFENLGDAYSDIKASVSSAKRAGLEVWGIDEIATKLEKYINLTGATK